MMENEGKAVEDKVACEGIRASGVGRTLDQCLGKDIWSNVSKIERSRIG
jgi:hypothetical protein